MMNREIKFRAWLFGKMGEPFNPFDPVFMASGGTFPDETIIMQYTGIKDKRGRAIYEGDIVKYLLPGINKKDPDVEYIEEVEFKDGSFVCETTPIYVIADWNAEVIGNIYQNPELLK